jgi:hypothetical protein
MISEYVFEYYHEPSDQTYDCTVELINTFEPKYGADIDGNRGEPKNFVEVESFHVFDNSGNLILDKEVIQGAEKEFNRKHDEKASQICVDEYHDESN